MHRENHPTSDTQQSPLPNKITSSSNGMTATATPTSTLPTFNKLLFLGCGAVAQNCLAVINRYFPDLDFKKVIILDKQASVAQSKVVQNALEKGATFHCIKISASNYKSTLEALIQKGDYIIDLTFGVGCRDIVIHCLQTGIGYINTALEVWDDEEAVSHSQQWILDVQQHPQNTELLLSRTLHTRQHDLKRAIAEVVENMSSGPISNIIIDHGMNPGLVSHFVKVSLLKIAASVCSSTSSSSSIDITELQAAQKSRNYAKLAQLLKLRTIHISEKDNQVPLEEFKRKENEFLSTWSCDGFFEEGLDPTQLGYGTHEQTLPQNALYPSPEKEQNQIFLPIPGVQVLIKSYVPTFGEIAGYNIPHSEGSTLASFLTIRSEKGECIYRPTCHYVYSPPQCAVESWKACLEQPVGHRVIPAPRVLKGHEIKEGRDAVGALLMFQSDPFGVEEGPWVYWAGSIVSVEENLKVTGAFSAPTTVQVAASVLAATKWALASPHRGVMWPEQVDEEAVLGMATPLLGQVVFQAVKWNGVPSTLQFADFLLENAGHEGKVPDNSR